MAEFDHAVVGAGIVGSWTALHLQKLGKKVLLIEQFGEAHSRGSSHGPTRVIRSCYPELFFAEMVPQAWKIWREAEAESGQTLMENVGCLCIASSEKDVPTYNQCVANMKAVCAQNIDENDPRIAKWLSTILKYDTKKVAMDKTGGVLYAERSGLTIKSLFRQHGGQIWNNCSVKKIEPISDDEVKLHTNRPEVVTVKSVVVCAGTWSSRLLAPFLPNLPLKPHVVRVYYWKEKVEGTYGIKNGFPTFIDMGTPEIYGLPSNEYPGLMKVCIHGGVECNPDERDRTKQCPKLEKTLKDYVKEHFPFLEEEPAIVETCMYTMTPDEIFLIDYVPQHKNIVYGSGFSGSGFKTSPAVGRILSEMATGAKPFLDITPFRLDRFKSQ